MSEQELRNPYLYDKGFNDQPIGPGAEPGFLVETKGFSKLIVMSKGDQTCDVYCTPSPNGSTMFTELKETLSAAVPANTPNIDVVANFAPFLYITVKNTSGSAGKYDVWIYGV